MVHRNPGSVGQDWSTSLFANWDHAAAQVKREMREEQVEEQEEERCQQKGAAKSHRTNASNGPKRHYRT